MNNFLITPIEYLKGVGPQRAELLKKELGVFTFGDLLEYFPFRYVDRSAYQKISDVVNSDGFVQIKGQIVGFLEGGSGRSKRLTAKFQDDSGMIDLVWFKGVHWVKSSLKINTNIQIYGKPKLFNGKWNIPHPEVSEIANTGVTGFQPVYSSTEKLMARGLNTKGIEKLVKVLLEEFKHPVEEHFSPEICKEYRLIERMQALKWIHMPTSEDQARAARFRLKFEELFFLQMELLVRKMISMQKSKGYVMKEVGDAFNTFFNDHLPFELTGAQKKVVKEIRRDLISGHHMNRLLQGDVGSGKTLVALLTMLFGIGNDFQVALMAPTEILADQHFTGLKEYADELGLSIDKLTGSTTKAKRKVL
ncbi:MAG: DEAD/DEAH box helicase, partial [Crocinitomicaceae bacterium]|nr:DEAD/DEAH box helicase [Crocinitomicaceae bacterium]